MSERIVFRSATDKDIPEIVQLVRTVLSEFNFEFNPKTSESDLSDLDATYFRNGGAFEVVENAHSKIIGTIGLLKLTNEQAKLRKMYVDENYRSAGLGRQLVRRAIDKADELGFKEIVLETVHSMIAAIQLYEKFGFQRVDGMKAKSPRCDIVMKLKLKHNKGSHSKTLPMN